MHTHLHTHKGGIFLIIVSVKCLERVGNIHVGYLNLPYNYGFVSGHGSLTQLFISQFYLCLCYFAIAGTKHHGQRNYLKKSWIGRIAPEGLCLWWWREGIDADSWSSGWALTPWSQSRRQRAQRECCGLWKPQSPLAPSDTPLPMRPHLLTVLYQFHQLGTQDSNIRICEGRIHSNHCILQC